jgi:hypothetical protein
MLNQEIMVDQLRFGLASPEDAQKVEAFNQRLAAAGETDHYLSLEKPFRTMAHLENSPITVERLFCYDGDEVRGGVIIKRMMFRINGSSEEVACDIYPLSESIVNPAFKPVWASMRAEMDRRYPLRYTSGADKAKRIVRLISLPIPFHFAVLRASPFLRNFSYLRSRKWMRILLDLAAYSGVGTIGLAIFEKLQRFRRLYPNIEGLTVERFGDWGDWADEIWEEVRDRYTLIGDRSMAALQSLYPVDNEHLIKLLFKTAGAKRPIGWAVLTYSKLRKHKYFGGMVLAALVDVLAAPEDAYSVASGALVSAKQARADLFVVNHSDMRWNEAFKKSGMIPWKTNFHLFLSHKLKERFDPLEDFAGRFFFTRGDGHGPTSLWMTDYHSKNPNAQVQEFVVSA